MAKVLVRGLASLKQTDEPLMLKQSTLYPLLVAGSPRPPPAENRRHYHCSEELAAGNLLQYGTRVVWRTVLVLYCTVLQNACQLLLMREKNANCYQARAAFILSHSPMQCTCSPYVPDMISYGRSKAIAFVLSSMLFCRQMLQYIWLANVQR